MRERLRQLLSKKLKKLEQRPNQRTVLKIKMLKNVEQNIKKANPVLIVQKGKGKSGVGKGKSKPRSKNKVLV